MKQAGIPILCIAIFLRAYSGLRLLSWSTVTENQSNPRLIQLWASMAVWIVGGYNRVGSGSAFHSTGPFYKLVGNVPRAVATFQFLFSVACWGVLAVLVARAVQVSLLKPIAFLIVLLFSLSDQIIMWDSFLLSESIALSLMAILVASGVWLLEGWHWGKALFLVVVAFLWTFTRDTNPWVILMLAALSIVSQPRSLRVYFDGSGWFVALFTAAEVSQHYSKNWVQPFVKCIGAQNTA